MSNSVFITSYTRISVLLRNYVRRSFLPFPYKTLSIYLLSILFLSLIVWSGDSGTLVLQLPGISDIPLPLYGNDREQSILLLLSQGFSWCWLFLASFYMLPRLLFPLGDLSLVEQSLWLRLSSYHPRELALVKALWVAYWAILFALLGSIWIVVAGLFHGVPPHKLLELAIGQSAYVVLCGGVLSIFDSFLKTDLSERKVLSTAVFCMPLILLLIFFGVKDSLPSTVADIFPYALPFTWGLENNWHHFISALVIGSFFLMLSVFTKFGRIVTYSSSESAKR